MDQKQTRGERSEREGRDTFGRARGDEQIGQHEKQNACWRLNPEWNIRKPLESGGVSVIKYVTRGSKMSETLALSNTRGAHPAGDGAGIFCKNK